MKILLSILCLLILVSCSPTPEIPSDQLVERNGIKYQVNSQTPFKGVEVNYRENGQLEFRKNYKNGIQDGLYEEYYENGQLKQKGNFKDGTYDGLQEWFDENGKLRDKGNFKDDKEDGLWESFNEYGNLTKTEEWKDGVLQE